jgi:hypothetical protein
MQKTHQFGKHKKKSSSFARQSSVNLEEIAAIRRDFRTNKIGIEPPSASGGRMKNRHMSVPYGLASSAVFNKIKNPLNFDNTETKVS